MAEKRYYWFKLYEGFFNDPVKKKLRRIAGGDTFTIIYLKMQLLSLKTDGILTFEGIEDTFAEELALIIDEETDNIKMTLAFLTSNKLIECSENQFLLPETVHNIGSETANAERVRKFRERQGKDKALLCNGSVTKCNADIYISISNTINSLISHGFNEFYEKYPRKVDRKKAETKYANILKNLKTEEEVKSKQAEILDGLNCYIKEIESKKTEAKFVAHPTTWLNGERWKDEYCTKEQKQAEDMWAKYTL